ncbi:MAG TPA: NAD(P)/FAD-dependent oxidoreductase [Candidatus Eremiobacteraceae bacterium]|nr:NAD(P)/FAD-dependent oxidoreductase [Candidatus Eremiobacteraceae bacterium]
MPDTPRTVQRIVILGGGFGGVYAAMALQKAVRHRSDVDITLVARENFFLFTPMLPQAATSSIDTHHIVVNLRRILPRVRVLEAEIDSIDLAAHRVTITHGDGHPHDVDWDQLIIAVGGETNYFGLPGVAEHALTIRTLADAVVLRNRAIDMLEQAELEDDPDVRKRLLTFVVAGGGFAGIETAAELDLFMRTAAKMYRNVKPSEITTVVVDVRTSILPELSDELGRWTQRALEKRGVRFRLGVGVKSADAAGVTLADGTRLDTQVFVWAGGVSANPLVAGLPCANERGRVPVDADLAVPGYPGVWCVGDSAVVTPPGGGAPYPPTAQHALREGLHVARNVMAAIDGKPLRPFAYTTVGQMAHLGERQAVVMLGGLKISGFPAWWLWRTYYLFRIPTLERKIRVAIDWTLDLLFSRDTVQVKLPERKSG